MSDSGTGQGRLGLLRALILEDSKDDALLLVRQLRRYGYEVVAERVQAAEPMAAMLRHLEFDVILADYYMPGFTALDGLGVLRRSGKDIPLIVVSGSMGEDIAVEAVKAGARDYLMKDNLQRLGVAVEREVQEAAVRRSQQSPAGWESVRAQAALAEAEQRADGLTERLARLAALSQSAAHSLQTPLRSLAAQTRVLLDHLRDRHQDDPEAVMLAEGLTRTARQSQELLEMWAACSQFALIKDFTPEPPGQVLAAVLATRRELLERTGASVRHGELPLLHVHGRLLAQIFQHVIDTMVESAPPDQPARIFAAMQEQGPDLASVVLLDEAVSADAPVQPAVLPHRSTSLLLAQQLVEWLGGRCTAECQDGRVTRIRFSLPLAHPGPRLSAPTPLSDVIPADRA